MLPFRLQEADADVRGLVLSATAGNLIGSLLTAIGRGGNLALHKYRRLPINKTDLQRAERWFTRWGRPALLLAWMPIVGDPLCLLAGLLRVAWLPFVILVGIGKLARYAELAPLAV